MIKSENGFVQIKGSTATVLTELTMIIDAIKDCGIEKDLVEHAVRFAYMSREEVRKEAEDIKKECVSRISQKVMEGLDETAKASYTGTEKSDQ